MPGRFTFRGDARRLFHQYTGLVYPVCLKCGRDVNEVIIDRTMKWREADNGYEMEPVIGPLIYIVSCRGEIWRSDQSGEATILHPLPALENKSR